MRYGFQSIVVWFIHRLDDVVDTSIGCYVWRLRPHEYLSRAGSCSGSSRCNSSSAVFDDDDIDI